MKKTILCLITLFNIICKAQGVVASLNQVPILLHPSMVGSSQNKRVAAVYQNNKGELFYEHNMTLVYDQIWKKLGSGLGGYLDFNKAPNFIKTNPYLKKSTQLYAGVSFAPKYNIMKKDLPNEVRFTWSPSISLDYSNQVFIYDTEKFILDSNRSFSKDYLADKRHHSGRLNIGGLLNSKCLILGGAISYNIRNYSYYYDPKKSYLSYMLMAGYSFSKNDNSMFGLSVLGKAQLKIQDSNQFVSSRFKFLQIYLNFNLRIWKIFTGWSSGMYYYVGYKAKNWKVTTGITFYKDLTGKYAVGLSETSFSYTFK